MQPKANSNGNADEQPAFVSFSSSASAAGLRQKAARGTVNYAKPKASFDDGDYEGDGGDGNNDSALRDVRMFSSFTSLTGGLVVKDGSGREKKITALMQLPLRRPGFTALGNTIERVSDAEVVLAGHPIRIADTLSEPEPEVEAEPAAPVIDAAAAAALQRSLFDDDDDLFADFSAALPVRPPPQDAAERTEEEPQAAEATPAGPAEPRVGSAEAAPPQDAEPPRPAEPRKSPIRTTDMWGEESTGTSDTLPPSRNESAGSNPAIRSRHKMFNSIFDEEEPTVSRTSKPAVEVATVTPQPVAPQPSVVPPVAERPASRTSKKSLWDDL
eukprot:TRINITY_DN6098_c0_g1_i1.p1 TRINITY_DN6098_c0_g1~~TRINITY_DN6098_c0_g1_i1.p1  ORF type:complete len:328 (+),score=63.71 TRINITY_DN6098_c0_g1_i1:119-1102(+)